MARLAVPAVSVLLAALSVPAAPARSAPVPVATEPALDSGGGAEAATLVLARDRDAQAAAAVDGLKLALRPGHLTDPMPGIDRSYGLETLRSDYSEMQRRAAGFRATLGSQHPTLAAADQILADLRGQLLGATRKALASAERDAAAAHAALASAEDAAAAAQGALLAAGRDAAAARASRAAEVTGAIGPVEEPPGRSAREASRRPSRADAPAAQRASAPPEAPADTRQGAAAWQLAAAAVSGLLALLSAGWAARRLLRSSRRPPRSRFTLHRREPGLASDALQGPTPRRPEAAGPAAPPSPSRPAPEPPTPPAPVRTGPGDDLAALATLPLPRTGAADLALAMAADPGGPLGLAAARLHAAAFAMAGAAAGERLTVLVTGVGETRDADADLAALALALAAAAAGGHVALMEARRVGRLRRDLVPAQTRPDLIEAGGTARTLYRLAAPRGTVAVLPCDASEAAALAALPPGAARQRGFEGFDLVVMVGEELSTLARGADLVVVAAAPSVSEADVAALARLCRAAGRPCGGVVVERPVAADAPMAVAAARRRAAVPPSARPVAGRLQLRGTLEPLRQGAG